MEKEKITQVELAEKSGIAKESISRYLTGVKIPRLSTAKHIADTCNVPIDIFTSKATQQIFFGKVFLKHPEKYERGGK